MAIALATAAVDGSRVGGTTCTYNITPAGSNRLMLIGTTVLAGDTLTSAVFNTTETATLVGKVAIPTQGWEVYLHRLVAPTTVAANVVVTVSGSTNIFSTAWVLSGVDQTNPIDGFTTNTGSAVTTLACSVTVTAANCWLAAYFGSGNVTDLVGGTNFTARNTTPGQFVAGDSNAKVSTGAQNIAVNCSSTTIAGVAASIAPVAPTLTRRSFSLLGIS